MASRVRRNAQEVLNGPLARSTYLLPMYGAYVVFTLNPVATLEALEDPIATEQAAALTTKKYVGYISRVSDLALPERRYHRCTCHLLSNSFPAASEADHTEETMFIPIAPATHPEGRTALTPTPPLPWDGLYHHTLEEIDLRVTTDSSPSVDHSLSPMLPMRGILEMKRVVNADFWRQSQLQTAYEAAHPESSQKPTLFPCPLAEDDSDHDNDRDDRSSYYSDGSDSEDLSESSDASSDDLNWIPETLRDPFVVREDPAHRFMPVVDFNVDLSTVPEFTDAKYFFEDIAAIERYVQCP
ncbi:hypothetical protein FA95DRAFT_1498302 [Auriscalpium vulgare]|uniref:Uncharacterized protein n=1 Tax=Auriscalpium vulgare TaxID=40419 RepID=A0ACB8RJ10_9AGAM|nr:hypothetical protein FA95DRAFT_1498302 [Auriscalpium vulgare]